MIMNFFKHLHTINKHRFIVFKLCTKCGYPIRGLLHDLSKYHPVEFFEGVKYYTDGKKSPILTAKKELGYSKAWLHHKGRNKHHSEYYLDMTSPIKAPIIPFKYMVEMVCDKIAATKVYEGKKYKNISPYYAWNRSRDLEYMNKKMKGFLTEVFEVLGAYGEKKVLNKKYLKEVYDKHVYRKGRKIWERK